ncbi:MAG TPA: hypothetical protein EYP35_00590 [Desulfobacterales bacterium]|nr:hypothetical protein [Desulfobacterales bacterium]
MKFIFAVLFVLVMSGTLSAADATFSWLPNSEPDLAGYKIHYGPASRQYETVIDVGIPDQVNGRVEYSAQDIPDEKTYFAATAYDTEGLESDYSDEITYNPAPAPPSGFQVTISITTTTVIK